MNPSLFRYRRCSPASLLFALLLFALPSPAPAQEIAVPQSLEDALHRMSDDAGIIFAGEVTAIRHLAGEQDSSGIVEVDFRVDQAIRGCSTGAYTLREWSGLWQGSDQRYRIGQRFLMLLHTPNAAGLTSPVEGPDGAIPLLTMPSTDNSPAITVDFRWIETHILQSALYSASNRIAHQAAASRVRPEDASSPISQQSPLSTVVEKLHSWKQEAP
ncbi:hypothetical protein [Edaphobacter albus]|uniref:hypothetical protein n=1 Tax=Edaphobacter sp. 4G125 TaxID=2763071 RepID=UPI0016490D4A|nr:hypothetical protein [Edaphobacter sp. 4G125]QNI36608.1 hypothetical protein H7846_16940 [Edaphobacter sp. 4G125]